MEEKKGAMVFIQQLATDDSITITRIGENFQYQHKTDKEPVNASMAAVFLAADIASETIDKILASLMLLGNSMKAIADQGKDLDEYGIRGVAAMCDALFDMATYASNDRFIEHQIIKAMAATARNAA